MSPRRPDVAPRVSPARPWRPADVLTFVAVPAVLALSWWYVAVVIL